MGKACLATGKSGPLLAEIVQRCADRERQILVTRSGQLDLDGTDNDAVSVISWNRRSALSARSVLLHATNLFGRLDEAVVVFAPASGAGVFHESSIVSIEDRIDAEVKGYLYILRETLAHLAKQGSGRLALVMRRPPEELLSPLEACAVGSFKSLSESICRLYRNEPVTIGRFESEADEPVTYADVVVSWLDAPDRQAKRASDHWIRHPSRLRMPFRS